MVSVVSQPYTSANFSYSSSMGQNSIKQNRPFNLDDLRRCMKEGLTYKEIKEQYPGLPLERYRKMLKVSGFQPDHVRIAKRVDADIVQLHNAGVSAEKIAEKYNWTLGHCKQRLANLGISTLVFEKEEFSDKLIAKVRKMAEVEGKSQKEISEKLKLGIPKLRMIMEENDIMTPAMRQMERVGDLTRSKITEALAKFGSLRGASEHLGVSQSSLKRCAQLFNIVV